jgi:hypothetical protein
MTSELGIPRFFFPSDIVAANPACPLRIPTLECGGFPPLCFIVTPGKNLCWRAASPPLSGKQKVSLPG